MPFACRRLSIFVVPMACALAGPWLAHCSDASPPSGGELSDAASDANDDPGGPDAGPGEPGTGTTDECDALVPRFDGGEQLVTNPFVGVCLVHRTTTRPRPLSYRVALIHPRAPGVRFTVTPHNGAAPRDTTRQTTRAFLVERKAQLAVNANFFAPFPPVDPYADIRGLAVSEGTVYGRFSEAYYAGLNIDEGGEVRVVHPAKDDPDGTKTAESAVLHNAVGTREQILANGAPTAVSTGASGENHPRTAAGVTRDGRLVLLVVDGRQAAISEGVTTSELASMLATDFAVVDAINLDGGGSTSLAIADPIPRLDHVPSGLAEEREVGNSLAVFATPRSAESTGDLIAYEPFSYARRPWGGSVWPVGGGLDNLLGGSGFASAWHDDHTHERASGIAVYPGDARDDPEDRRQAALAYTDGSGRKLRTSGNQMRTSLGRSSRVWRALDLSRVAQRDRTPTGQLGASNTTLWLSFLAQSYNALSGDRWSYIELGNTLRIGRLGGESGNWGLGIAGVAAVASRVAAETPSLIVVRLQFADGTDQATMWINPPLGTSPPDAADATVAVANLAFSQIVVTGSYSTDFDELRLGTTWAAVTPAE